MPRLATLMLVFAALLAPSCEQQSNSTKKGAKASTTKTGTKKNSGTSTGTPDCNVPSGDSEEGNTEKASGDDDEMGLVLAGVYYEDVKSIIESKCQACHPSYGTYKGAKEDAVKSLATIKNGTMPKGKKLTADEKATFKAWVDGGALEKATSTSSGTGAGSPSSDDSGSSDSSAAEEPAATPCPQIATGDDGNEGTTNDDFKADPSAFKDILDPPERAVCLAQKGCWYRKGVDSSSVGQCYKNASGVAATCPATFTCDRAGVMQAFGSSAELKTELDTKEAEGWTYDSCGTIGGKPIVFFACYHAGDDKCTTVDAINGDTLGIKASLIAAP